MISRGAGFHGIHVVFLSMPFYVTVFAGLRADTMVTGLPPAFACKIVVETVWDTPFGSSNIIFGPAANRPDL